MQSLREEEERIAEEDAEDDIMLSYDRPELANKVILRRHSSTGMWEVCSPSKKKQCSNEISVSVTDTDSTVSEGSHSGGQVDESYATNLQSQGNLISLEDDEAEPGEADGMSNVTSFSDQTLKARIPRSLQFESHDIHVKGWQCHKAETETDLESDSHLLFDGMTSDGGNTVNFSSTTRRKSLDRDFKQPRVCLSPALGFSPRPQSNNDHGSSNQVVESYTSKLQNDCIGLRTRQRAKTQVLTTSGSSVSSPSQPDKGSTVSHKYPTRHKVTDQS